MRCLFYRILNYVDEEVAQILMKSDIVRIIICHFSDKNVQSRVAGGNPPGKESAAFPDS